MSDKTSWETNVNSNLGTPLCAEESLTHWIPTKHEREYFIRILDHYLSVHVEDKIVICVW